MPQTIDNENLPESQVFEHTGIYYNAQTWTRCTHSGEPVRICHTFPDANGRLYHPANYYNLFSDCNGCNSEINRSERRNIGGDNYCPTCFAEGVDTCPGCDESVHVSNCRRHPETEEPWHAHCYNDRYQNCTGCGVVIDVEDPDTQHTDDGYYCCDCEHYDAWWGASTFRGAEIYDEIRSTRKFGVELETSACAGYQDLSGKFKFGAEQDGSISGVEFVSSILYGDDGLKEVTDFCKEAMRRNFALDVHCGMHIHLDVSDLNAKQLINVCAAYQLTYEVWACFLPNSRILNRFCVANDWTYKDFTFINTPDDFRENSYRSNRQQWFNIDAYNRHRTFEIRLHTATLSGKKITNWVKAHARFIDAVKDIPHRELEQRFGGTVQDNFNEMVLLWDDSKLANFYAFRSRKFGKALKVEKAGILV